MSVSIELLFAEIGQDLKIFHSNDNRIIKNES